MLSVLWIKVFTFSSGIRLSFFPFHRQNDSCITTLNTLVTAFLENPSIKHRNALKIPNHAINFNFCAPNRKQNNVVHTRVLRMMYSVKHLHNNFKHSVFFIFILKSVGSHLNMRHFMIMLCYEMLHHNLKRFWPEKN